MNKEEYYKNIAEEIDKDAVKVLNENGYKIEKPYTVEKVQEIAKQLKKDGKKLVQRIETELIYWNNVNGKYEFKHKLIWELVEDK